MPELKASPRNAILGTISDMLASAKAQGNRADLPIFGGLGDLMLGKTPEEVNEWAYGNTPMRVAGGGTGSYVPQMKASRSEQLLDAATTLPAMAQAIKQLPKGALALLSRVTAPQMPTRALPEGMAIREFGHSAAEREQIDALLQPLLAPRSPVDPDDRDIFMAMRNTYKMNPEARTRFLMQGDNPRGAYQIMNRGAESYIPNVAVAERGRGHGRTLMNHAISNRENPSFLVSAPGKEAFYRKLGMKEQQDDGISSFHFKNGGLITAGNDDDFSYPGHF